MNKSSSFVLCFEFQYCYLALDGIRRTHWIDVLVDVPLRAMPDSNDPNPPPECGPKEFAPLASTLEAGGGTDRAGTWHVFYDEMFEGMLDDFVKNKICQEMLVAKKEREAKLRALFVIETLKGPCFAARSLHALCSVFAGTLSFGNTRFFQTLAIPAEYFCTKMYRFTDGV